MSNAKRSSRTRTRRPFVRKKKIGAPNRKHGRKKGRRSLPPNLLRRTTARTQPSPKRPNQPKRKLEQAAKRGRKRPSPRKPKENQTIPDRLNRPKTVTAT